MLKEFFAACMKGNLMVVKDFILKDKDILHKCSAKRFWGLDKAMSIGWTPLLEATHAGHLKVMEVLIGAGAAVNQAPNNGATPLIFAAQNGHLNVVEVDIAKGRPTFFSVFFCPGG
jgi:hypothetical protein